MTEKHQNGMQCSQFEALLPDVLDNANANANVNAETGANALSPELNRAFQEHAASCPACGPIFKEARQGMLWLQALEEVEPPVNLVHNILAATSAAERAKESALAKAVRSGWLVRSMRWWKAARGMLTAALQPRFATSFSMAFFSLSLTLTLAGFKLKDLTHIDWRPNAVGRAVVLQYTRLESKVVRYYNNMRLVYEIESRVGELRKNSSAGEKEQQPANFQEKDQREKDQLKKEKNKKDTNDTSGRPEERQDNYSREMDNATIAYLTPDDEGANQ